MIGNLCVGWISAVLSVTGAVQDCLVARGSKVYSDGGSSVDAALVRCYIICNKDDASWSTNHYFVQYKVSLVGHATAYVRTYKVSMKTLEICQYASLIFHARTSTNMCTSFNAKRC